MCACAHAVCLPLERRRGNRLARVALDDCEPSRDRNGGETRSPSIPYRSPTTLPYRSPTVPLATPFALPFMLPLLPFACAFAWFCALCVGAVLFSAFFAKPSRFSADDMRMDNHCCFPLPLVTHRLLIRFWMLDPNGASLCISDLLDGLCPLQLADELEQTIARLEASTL